MFVISRRLSGTSSRRRGFPSAVCYIRCLCLWPWSIINTTVCFPHTKPQLPEWPVKKVQRVYFETTVVLCTTSLCTSEISVLGDVFTFLILHLIMGWDPDSEAPPLPCSEEEKEGHGSVPTWKGSDLYHLYTLHTCFCHLLFLFLHLLFSPNSMRLWPLRPTEV